MKKKISRHKRTFLLLVFALIFHTFPYSVYAYGETLSERIVIAAKAELGNGESGKNNFGKDIRRYMQGKEGNAWCAGFASWVLFEAKVETLGYLFSAKQIYNEAKKRDFTVENPQAGDLVIFWRETKNSWKGHVGIVISADTEKIITIEGNRGKFPAKVRKFTYEKDNVLKLIGYVRIPER